MLVGVHVKTTRRRRGDKSYEYLSLVESVRKDGKNTHRTLLRLGEVTALRQSGELERVIAALQAHLGRDRVALAALTAEDARSVGSVAAVAAVWEGLGLDVWFAKQGAERGAEVLAEAVFAMVANRLVDPCSKRRLGEWVSADVAMPQGWSEPSLDQYYRAIGAVAACKEATETELYVRLCDLTNMDLQMVCYDLTSTYFEGSPQRRDRFPCAECKAPIASEEIGHVAYVLLQNRVAESEFGFEFRDGPIRSERTEEEPGRIAGHDPQDDEGKDRRAE